MDGRRPKVIVFDVHETLWDTTALADSFEEVEDAKKALLAEPSTPCWLEPPQGSTVPGSARTDSLQQVWFWVWAPPLRQRPVTGGGRWSCG